MSPEGHNFCTREGKKSEFSSLTIVTAPWFSHRGMAILGSPILLILKSKEYRPLIDIVNYE